MFNNFHILWHLGFKAGIATFSEIKVSLKNEHTTTSMYKSIETDSNTISLSGKHLIYGRKNDGDKFSPRVSYLIFNNLANAIYDL